MKDSQPAVRALTPNELSALQAQVQAFERQALQAEGKDQEAWARAQHNLGELNRILAQSIPGETSEIAIRHFQQALQVFTEHSFPRDFGLAANSLGAAYLGRALGDASENVEAAIGYLNAALRVRPRDRVPEYWAKTHINLASAYRYRVLGEAQANLRSCIDHLELALTAPRSAYVEGLRGPLEYQLAEAYFQCQQPDPTSDLNRTIEHARFASDCAMGRATEMVEPILLLAQAVCALDPRPEQLVEEAIAKLEPLVSKDQAWDSPARLALAFMQLGMLYEFRTSASVAATEDAKIELPSFDDQQTLNRSRAIEHYRSAGHIFEGIGNFTQAAACMYWVASVTRQQTSIPPTERTRQAIADIESALCLMPTDAETPLRYHMHWELGEACLDAATESGDRGEGVRMAIDHLTFAVQALDASDLVYARAHAALGVAYYEWRGGDRSQNLEYAIDHQAAALATLNREHEPVRWAAAHHNLGNALCERTSGNQRENIERAIAHLNDALTVESRDADPEAWANSMNSLANAFCKRLEGDHADNVEKAINYLNQALEVYCEDDYPLDWAMTLNNLGSVMMRRIAGYRADNTELAIDAFNKSLSYRTREAQPFFWAMTHVNLAAAYKQRAHGLPHENQRLVVEHGLAALDVYTREHAPYHWAWVHLQLGTTATGALSCDERIAHLKQALEVYTPEVDPTRFAYAQNNLALLFRERAADPSAHQQTNHQETIHQQAVACLKLALQATSADSDPLLMRSLLTNLADEYMRAGHWQSALDQYRDAIALSETLLSATGSESGRLSEADISGSQFNSAAFCLLKLGQIAEGLIMLESGRTRQLNERLARSGADLKCLPHELAERIRAARAHLDTVIASMRLRDEDLPPADVLPMRSIDNPDQSALRAGSEDISVGQLNIGMIWKGTAAVGSFSWRQARAWLREQGVAFDFAAMARLAREKVASLIEEARTYDANFMRATTGLHDIVDLAPIDGAHVSFVLTPVGSAAIVVPHGNQTIDTQHVIDFDDGFLLKIKQLTQNWLDGYLDFTERFNLEAWQNILERTTAELWNLIGQPVSQRLERLGVKRLSSVILFPQSYLALLPLHAAWRYAGDQRIYWMDETSLHYAPSFYALKVARDRAAMIDSAELRLLAVIDPTEDLPYAKLEGEAVASHFLARECMVLSQAQATESAVMAHVAGAHYLHFATHGIYDWKDIMCSHLMLASHTRLTLGHVVSPEFDLSAARLVFLSACESALIDFQTAPDEFQGFPVGFMEGGAPGVISALWPVSDVSTALLVRRFYTLHLEENLPVDEALRKAQIWLRSSSVTALGLADQWQQVLESSKGRNRLARRMLEYCRQNPDAVPYSSSFYWAALVFNGA